MTVPAIAGRALLVRCCARRAPSVLALLPYTCGVWRARISRISRRAQKRPWPKENEWAPKNTGGSNVIFFSQIYSHGGKSPRSGLGAPHVFLRRWSQALCTGATAV